jgi:hypothetical protein
MKLESRSTIPAKAVEFTPSEKGMSRGVRPIHERNIFPAYRHAGIRRIADRQERKQRESRLDAKGGMNNKANRPVEVTPTSCHFSCQSTRRASFPGHLTGDVRSSLRSNKIPGITKLESRSTIPAKAVEFTRSEDWMSRGVRPSHQHSIFPAIRHAGIRKDRRPPGAEAERL